MLARVNSFVLMGIDATACEIEVHLDEGDLARDVIVGLPDAAVKESSERVKSALRTSGYGPPRGRLLVNLAPADVRKEGPVYDLPIAVGVLAASGVVAPERSESGLDLGAYLLAGELALDGRLRPVRGAIAMAALAREMGKRGVIVPRENAAEAAVFEDVEVIGAGSLAEVVGVVNGALEAKRTAAADLDTMLAATRASVDFSEVRGQEGVKRALTIAAAGEHNVLMIGPPGSGKTMLAKALPGILPALTPEEAIEATRVHSAANSGGGGLVTARPVRSPHHTASMAALIGGGPSPRPGEVSLAHRGVLFLDELAEFPRPVLETLRQPLEDGHVTVSRATAKVGFPASFMLVAAMNPTPGGRAPAANDGAGRREMERYMGRLSGPLVDRIDIHVEAPAVGWKELSAEGPPRGETSERVRERVMSARDRQRARQGVMPNARLRGRALDEVARLEESARALLGEALNALGLSARAYDKIRRVARTIADLEGRDSVTISDVAEAVQYRLLDRRV